MASLSIQDLYKMSSLNLDGWCFGNCDIIDHGKLMLYINNSLIYTNISTTIKQCMTYIREHSEFLTRDGRWDFTEKACWKLIPPFNILPKFNTPFNF